MDSEAKAEALLTELKNNKLAKVAAGESSNVAKVHVPVQRTLSELDWAGEAQLEGEALVEPPSQTSLPNKMMEQGPKQYFPERSHWLPLPRFTPPGPGAIPKTKPSGSYKAGPNPVPNCQSGPKGNRPSKMPAYIVGEEIRDHLNGVKILSTQAQDDLRDLWLSDNWTI